MGASDTIGTNGRGQPRWQRKGNDIHWGAGPSDAIRATINSVTDAGASILFARTPDGRALVVRVYAGTDGCKEYVSDPADIGGLLQWVGTTFG